ncbi:conserved protein of unknown function [Agreia sp. COWG]|nr:conserved protein of unknown function [Agreia sp. COWG]
MAAAQRRVERDDDVLSRLAPEEVRQHKRHWIDSPHGRQLEYITMQTNAMGGWATKGHTPIVWCREMARVPPDSNVKQVVVVAPDATPAQNGETGQ